MCAFIFKQENIIREKEKKQNRQEREKEKKSKQADERQISREPEIHDIPQIPQGIYLYVDAAL